MKEHLPVRVGTRKSKLARWQADQVVDLLRKVHPGIVCKVKTLGTEGDRRPDVPLREMAGRGVFTGQLEEALKAVEIDIAVHSLKDLPTEQDPALCLAAVPNRGDPRECLISRSGAGLSSLPPGAVVGTSSSRREAQLRTLRPDLVFCPIRGNVDTRIRKVLEGSRYDATLLAAAAIRRLRLEEHVSEWFPLSRMLPAPGQAALAVQCRENDPVTRTIVSRIEDPGARASVTAERTFLEELGGGCSLPVAAFARWVESPGGGELCLKGTVFSVDGSHRISVNGAGDCPRELGRFVAHRALKKGALRLIRRGPRPPHPLAGKRLIVTRAAAQAKYLTDRLRSQGAKPLNLPLVRIAPLSKLDRCDEVLSRLDAYDWIVFTSVNAVKAWLQLEPDLEGLALAAVGPRTAAELERRGLQPSLVPKQFSKSQLVESMGDVRGLRILLPRGELAGPELANLLKERGARVNEVIVYRTLPVVPEQTQLSSLEEGLDAVLFTSSSAVRNFAAVLDRLPLRRELLQGAVVACIGPATAGTAVELGLVGPHSGSERVTEAISRRGSSVRGTPSGEPRDADSVEEAKQINSPAFAKLVVAEHYTTEGLVEALIDYYRKESGD